MSSTVYAGGLPYAPTNDRLEQMFADVARAASASVVAGKLTGRSSEFALVAMSSDGQARIALEMAEQRSRRLDFDCE